jgi:hypothetical protein
MSFESGVSAFAERFLSERTHRLIVEPALADLHFAGDTGRVANRIAVLRAVAGGLRGDLAGGSGVFLFLTLVPACYFLTMLILFLDFFTGMNTANVMTTLAIVSVMSVGPAMICFWPERRALPRVD